MTPPTKTARALAHFHSGDLRAALRIARSFRLGVTRSERAQLSRAYECFVRPAFYAQLGFTPEAEIEKGRALFARLFACKEPR